MSLSTDLPRHPRKLSPTSLRMQQLREAVLGAWEGRLRSEVPQAAVLQQPILIDTIASFYDNIVQSVTADYPREAGADGTTVAAEHGGERARLTSYDHGALIQEYQLFRWAIFDVLHTERVPLSRTEIHAINSSVDKAIQEAVEAFTLVTTGLRGRFAAALTHDMRGPLGAVAMALELVRHLDDPARVRIAVDKALKNVQRMSGMIDELLDTMVFHGGEKLQLKLSSFDVLDIVREVQADAIAAHGPRFDIVDKSVVGWWDRSALKRALENLVSNAVKYGAPHAPVTVRVDEAHGRLRLWVHNDGNPVPPQEQECIFQMYRRADAARQGVKEGWGIGLPYVRAVAESHAGSVSIDSSVERGTTFVIDIPVDIRPLPGAPTLA